MIAIDIGRTRLAGLVRFFVVVVPHRWDVDQLNLVEFLVVEPFQGRITGEKFVAPEKFTRQVRRAEMARETGPIERSFDDGDDLEMIVRQRAPLDAVEWTAVVDDVLDGRRPRKEELTVAQMCQLHVVDLMGNDFTFGSATLTNQQESNAGRDQLRDGQVA